MPRRQFSSIVGALLPVFAFMATVCFNIRTTSGFVVTIKADGGVDPTTVPILTLDDIIYTLTVNIYGI
jgi:Mn2+/Fe2+ NRAMP family transporter